MDSTEHAEYSRGVLKYAKELKRLSSFMSANVHGTAGCCSLSTVQ